jgi:hypothetical protein
MSAEKTSLAKDIEALLSKSIEANKVFMSEGTRMLKQFTLSGNKQNAFALNTNLLTDAFNAYAKLNIQHMKNMLDLSVSLFKQAGAQTNDTSPQNTTTEETAAPSFTLTTETTAGGKALLSFLLDNIKPEDVNCMLVNTPYHLQNDAANIANFETIFTPQSFNLKTNERQKVDIEINIPANITAGVYESDVQVKGFEPAFFNMLITVKELTENIK